MITLLLVLIVLCLIIPFRLVGFLMILGVIHHCTTADAGAATMAPDLAAITEKRGG